MSGSINTDNNHFDLCVIGAGPAGIILVLEYSKQNPGKTVALVEFGERNGKVENRLDDSVIVHNSINHHPPYECTNKGLGGTSMTWGGRCVMFDSVDFTERPVLNGACTWDTHFLDELKQYTSRASDYFDCGTDVFNLNEIPEFADQRIAENFKSGIVTDTVLERWSMPTRFGKRYLNELESNPNIVILEGFEATTFQSEADGCVQSVKLISTDGSNEKQIQASKFVISAGTQESTRLLLSNKSLFKALGAVPDALGRYYQGHLSGKIASVKFYGDPKKTDFGFLRDKDGTYIRRRFQFDSEFLKTNNLLNSAFWLDNPLYHDPGHRSGAMSFMYLAMITPFLGKRLAPPAIQNAFTKGKVQGIGKHILNIIKDLPQSLSVPVKIFYKRYCLKRKLPGVFLYSPKNTYAIHFHSEQVPEHSNCMTLSENSRNLEIFYKLSDADVDSVIRLHDELDRYLRTLNCGELLYWYPKAELAEVIRSISRDGIHQSGTTRIAENAASGVVDRNLKVFGTKNLFVCSSSVFPTSGQANPTYFLGACSVRLAHYLSKDIGCE